MSKGKSKFANLAARKFNDVSKVDTMSQRDIYEILNNADELLYQEKIAKKTGRAKE